MKLYKGITRFQFRRLYPKKSFRFLKWLVSLKPGDVVSSCVGFNVRIKSVKLIKMHCSTFYDVNPNKVDGWWINEIEIIDETGRYHIAPGCAWPKEPVARIEKYWMGYTEEYLQEQEALGWDHKFTRKIQGLLKAGKQVVDSDGVLLSGLNEPDPDVIFQGED